MDLAEQYISRAENIGWRIIDGEAVIILMGEGLLSKTDDSKIITLSDVGTKLWEKLEGKRKVSEVIKELTDILDVDYEENKEDLLDYIDKLIKEELIENFESM